MDTSFQLDQAVLDNIYSKIIEPISFLDTSSVEKPMLMIIAAQTGAGKSRLVQSAMKAFEGNVVSVNTDDLRAHHPRYEEIVMLDDTRSAERTHHDASAWRDKLLSRSIETHRNILLEGVFKNSDSLAEIVDSAKSAGYLIVIRIVSAHERYSVWGIYSRYEKEKIVRGHGRYVPIEYHDECYVKLLSTVEAIEQQKLADHLEVYDRNGELIYPNQLIEGSWKDAPKAREAVEEERNRKLNDKEREQYFEMWPPVFEAMKKREAPEDEVAKVKAMADRFIKELNE